MTSNTVHITCQLKIFYKGLVVFLESSEKFSYPEKLTKKINKCNENKASGRQRSHSVTTSSAFEGSMCMEKVTIQRMDMSQETGI